MCDSRESGVSSGDGKFDLVGAAGAFWIQRSSTNSSLLYAGVGMPSESTLLCLAIESSASSSAMRSVRNPSCSRSCLQQYRSETTLDSYPTAKNVLTSGRFLDICNESHCAHKTNRSVVLQNTSFSWRDSCRMPVLSLRFSQWLMETIPLTLVALAVEPPWLRGEGPLKLAIIDTASQLLHSPNIVVRSKNLRQVCRVVQDSTNTRIPMAQSRIGSTQSIAADALSKFAQPPQEIPLLDGSRRRKCFL